MSPKSALFSGLTALVLILALGNPPVSDELVGNGSTDTAALTRSALASPLRWDPDMPSELLGPTVLRLVVLVLAAALLGGIAGRARPLAALVGGWGAAFGALALSGVTFALVADERYNPAVLPGSDTLDQITAGARAGSGLAFWLGWLFGLAVLLGSFGKKQPKILPPGAVGGAPPPVSAPGWTPPAATAPAPAGPPLGSGPSPATEAYPVATPASAPGPFPVDQPTETVAIPPAPAPESAPADDPTAVGPSATPSSETAAPRPDDPTTVGPSTESPVIGTPPERLDRPPA